MGQNIDMGQMNVMGHKNDVGLYSRSGPNVDNTLDRTSPMDKVERPKIDLNPPSGLFSFTSQYERTNSLSSSARYQQLRRRIGAFSRRSPSKFLDRCRVERNKILHYRRSISGVSARATLVSSSHQGYLLLIAFLESKESIMKFETRLK